jgi:hypothetical protein
MPENGIREMIEYLVKHLDTVEDQNKDLLASVVVLNDKIDSLEERLIESDYTRPVDDYVGRF